MHVALIGGTGLIGAGCAVLLLARGHRVTLVSRNRPAQESALQWVAGDVANAAAIHGVLERARPDAVLHLAAYLQFACEKNPAQAVRINVDGTLNVLEACRTLGIGRLVYGGSIASYGERHDLMREDDPPAPNVGLYGVTKRLGEMLGARYAALHGLTFVALRYSGVFGPGKVRSAGMAMVRQQIKQTALGADAVIDGASGDECFHLTHVTDAAGATLAALVHPRPRHTVYNVAGPEANYLSLRAFHRTVCRLAPQTGEVRFTGRGKSAGPVDLSRLREDLGYSPTVSVQAGLASDLDVLRRPA